jgi:hypothetical protein
MITLSDAYPNLHVIDVPSSPRIAISIQADLPGSTELRKKEKFSQFLRAKAAYPLKKQVDSGADFAGSASTRQSRPAFASE